MRDSKAALDVLLTRGLRNSVCPRCRRGLTWFAVTYGPRERMRVRCQGCAAAWGWRYGYAAGRVGDHRIDHRIREVQ